MLVELSARWAAVVTLWCAVVWVSTGTQARLGRRSLVPATVAVVCGGWGVMALATSLTADVWLEWGVPWPGPFPGVQWAVAGVGVITPDDTWTMLVRPSAAAPALLLAALLGTAWAARRHHAATPLGSDAPSAWSERSALLTLGLPVLSLWAGAVLLQVEHDGSTATQSAVLALERTGAPLGAMILAGLALSGGGRASWAWVAAVQLVVVVPMFGAWWDGAPDDLLGVGGARRHRRRPGRPGDPGRPVDRRSRRPRTPRRP